mmetsp:Transcript_13635/g.27925  ORF Transcript_13635/g.27925 Transcript_13635/m.27925 type:complete len:414 (-) Transcript_13635:313-1554(-)
MSREAVWKDGTREVRIKVMQDGFVHASQMKRAAVTMYDPGFTNTASCTSRITFIDGEEGVLWYRGYPIEQLAKEASFLEVSYLLQSGELPTEAQLKSYTDAVSQWRGVHGAVLQVIERFPREAHPMAMLGAAVGVLGMIHWDANPSRVGAKAYSTPKQRETQIHRVLGALPSIAAAIQTHRSGRILTAPSPLRRNLTYTENFLYMLHANGDLNYTPNETFARALDVLLTLHADHELNCSTATMRQLSSSGVDVYTCLAGAIGALYGPLHGGANEEVLKMLSEIGSTDQIPGFISNVKEGKGLLYGFGHRVYRHYDPRAKLVRAIAYEVFAEMGERDPLIDLASELEKTALQDPYFVSRKLYPNVDFYSGLIYKALGFEPEFFTVIFALGRASGWMAHWLEFLDDKERKIARPR